MKAVIQRYLGLYLLLAAMAGHAQVPENAVWIDVRSRLEYALGNLPQAKLIYYEDIEEGVAELNLAKDTPIYLYCASGGRAGIAKEKLEAVGYTNVTNAGGLEDARKMATAVSP